VAQTASALGRALAVAKLGDAANTDSLTGLVNRGHFDRLLRARLDRPEPMVLLILDLDHFKAVNDVHGHSVGDAVLRETAIALRAACFANDVVARYGGEEFVVLTSGATLEATMTGERLRAAVSRAATPVPVTASIGAACYPAEEATAAALIETADQRLYTAKRTGRNRAVTSAAEVLAATHVQSGAPNADREADLPSS
jgi:two-component system cell cycle response regulator